MIARVPDGKPSKTISRCAVATLVAALSTASCLMLGTVDRRAIAQPLPAKPVASIQYSIDEESAAPFFADSNAKATTAGLVKWLKQQSESEKDAGKKLDRRLVLSSRQVRKEIGAYKDVIARIKDAKGDGTGAVTFSRLSVDVAPALSEQQPAAIDDYMKGIELAAKLGCEAVDFPLSASGGYADSKSRAVEAIKKIGERMATATDGSDKVALLFRNDANLGADGNWIAEVIREARRKLSPKIKLGVVLDVSKVEYQPAAFLRDLSNLPRDAGAGAAGGPEAVEPKEPGQPGPKKAGAPAPAPGQPDAGPPQDAKVRKPGDGPNPPADAAGGAGKPQDRRPAAQDDDDSSLVKVIVLDIYDPRPGQERYVVRGLSSFSKDDLKKRRFRGDITLRYRGASDLNEALGKARAMVVEVLGEPKKSE
jgi:hypothetical protein